MSEKIECPKCQAKLKVIEHSNGGPGGQEKEQGYCPKCGTLVVERMTSGLIAVRLDDGKPCAIGPTTRKRMHARRL
jgi:ribosomal protein L37AE/L43A